MKVEDFDMFSTLLRQRSGLVLSRDKAYLLEFAADAGRAQMEHEGAGRSGGRAFARGARKRCCVISRRR